MFIIMTLIFAAIIVLDVFDKFPLSGAVGKFVGMTIIPHIYLFVRMWLLPENFAEAEILGSVFFGYVNIILNAAPFVLFSIY